MHPQNQIVRAIIDDWRGDAGRDAGSATWLVDSHGTADPRILVSVVDLFARRNCMCRRDWSHALIRIKKHTYTTQFYADR